ncbi:MAG: hypothetical protein EPN94_12160 [Nitrospirae bacterium]|nr:MAG: hypothetical protein EPN94_12160 [Nitrospirota bacterium]
MWDEETQNEIEGVYVSAKDNVGTNNSTIYTLRTKDGEKSLWGSTLLDDRFNGIALGEEVKIVFLGKQKTKDGGRAYKNFDVYHRPATKPDNREIKVEDIPF